MKGWNTPVLSENILRRMRPEDRAPMGKGGRTMAEANAVADARLEKDLQKSIAQYLRQRGIAFCQPSYGRKTRIAVGWPDFTFPFFGRFIAIEAKSKLGKPSQEQKELHEKLLRQGATLVIATRLEAVKHVLDLIEAGDR